MKKKEISKISDIPNSYLFKLTNKEKQQLAKEFLGSGYFKEYSILYRNLDSAKVLLAEVIRTGNDAEKEKAKITIEKECKSSWEDFLTLVRVISSPFPPLIAGEL